MSTSSTIADSSAPSANHTIIRVGLIGVGNWALNGPVRVLSLMPQYEMAAVYSQRRDAAQSAADTFGIRHVVGSIGELVRHPDVDIVLVLTTGPQHEEAVRAAIAAGKTVYCEWPLTPDSKTSAELVDLAAKAGVQTILGTQRRFAPGLRYLKDLLGDGYVGRVRSVRMHVTVSSFGKNRSKALRWSAFPENFMGVTSIFGAHLMDPLFSIVGRPTEISAVSVNQWPEITIVETGEEISTKVPDQLLLQGILASGAVFAVHIEGGKHHGTGVQIDITGDDGDLQITNTSAFGDVGEEYNLFGARVADTKMAPLAVPASYNWLPPSDLPSGVLELADLFEVHARDLASGSRTVPSFEDALFMQRLLEQAAVSISAFGAYAMARLHPADRLVRIPAGVSDDQAASAFLKGLTARYLLKEVLKLRPGDTVLYHPAAGGVGQIFVQWAKALGLKVIGTVSSDAKAKLARHAGCAHVINYSSEDFVAEALAFTAGNGVAAVFDSVGADTFRGSLAVLRPRGTLVQFGKASGSPEPVDPFELAPRALYLTWPILPHYTSTAEDLAIAAADLFDAIATGILKVDPSNLYPFSQLIEAHHDLEERRTTGAAVLRVTAADLP